MPVSLLGFALFVVAWLGLIVTIGCIISSTIYVIKLIRKSKLDV